MEHGDNPGRDGAVDGGQVGFDPGDLGVRDEHVGGGVGRWLRLELVRTNHDDVHACVGTARSVSQVKQAQECDTLGAGLTGQVPGVVQRRCAVGLLVGSALTRNPRGEGRRVVLHVLVLQLVVTLNCAQPTSCPVSQCFKIHR